MGARRVFEQNSDEKLLAELDEKYRILALLGEGGTARVWLAMSEGPSGFSKLVVLKTIRRELLNDQAVVGMFLDEARIAARLNHPNVAQTNQVLEVRGHPVLVMEYLDGVPFSAVLERQREGNELALAMLLRVVSDALSGLQAAHELQDFDGSDLGVVHRDASPQNLFITFTGQVKVLDFGIAQLASSGFTETGVIKGKLRYIAPEQLEGERVDRRADLYSMGVVLWEVATARRMWEGLREPTILKRLTNHDLPRPQDINPAVDDRLAAIIEKSLSKNPNDRYATALEFQSALDSYLATLGSPLHNRDIGRALSKMFDDVRVERAATIEEQMKGSSSGFDHGGPATELVELTSFSNARGSQLVKRNWQAPLLIALFCLATLGLTMATLWKWPQQEAEQRRGAERNATRPGDTVSTQEPGRDLELSAPIAGPRQAAQDGSQAQGPEEAFAEEAFAEPAPPAKSARPTESAAFVGTAKPTESAVAARGANPAGTIVSRLRVPTRTPSPQDQDAKCAVPHYYDERGIKKYKPECLR